MSTQGAKYDWRQTAHIATSKSVVFSDSPYTVPYYVEQLWVDSSGGPITIQLLRTIMDYGMAASGRPGRTITITDISGKAGENPITILPAMEGELINGQLSYVMNIAKGTVTLRQTDGGWITILENFGGDKTTSLITMYISTTGTSPPSGIIVHNQAEYDALGYDLRYLQDALDILPVGIGHTVKIYLRDGTHLGKSTAGFAVFKPHVPTGLVAAASPYTQVGIYVIGQNKTTLDPEQAGTFAGRTLVRATGTWTVDQHRGKLIIVNTGVNAGAIAPIAGNTVDTIDLGGVYGTDGACTFTIFESSAVCLASTDGVNRNCTYMAAASFMMNRLYFDNIKFGTDALPAANGLLGNMTYFRYSTIVTNSQFVSTWSISNVGTVVCQYDAIKIVSGAGLRITKGSNLAGYMACFLDVVSASVPIGLYQGGSLSLYNTMVKTASGFAGNVLSFNQSGMLDCYESYLVGVGNTGTGIVFGLDEKGNGVGFRYAGINISGYNIAVSVLNGQYTLLSSAFAGSVGNNMGWSIVGGAKIITQGFSNIGATTELSIDGQSFAYSDITNVGDSITGQYGSVALKD